MYLREQCSGTTSVNQGLLAEIPWKTVAEIKIWGYLVKPELFTVKATLSVMNTEDLCYAACPLLVVNGNQCDGAVSSNGYEWWNCEGWNMTFVACDYRYRILIQLADSTGEIYATAS
jgi:replication factor A1